MSLVERSGQRRRVLGAVPAKLVATVGAVAIAVLGGVFAPGTARAEVSCTVGLGARFEAWTSPTLKLEAGHVLSTTTVTTSLSPFFISFSDEIWSVGGFTGNNFDTTWRAERIGFGLGLRLRYDSTTVTVPPQYTIGSEQSLNLLFDAVGSGTTIISKIPILMPTVANTPRQFSLRQTWKFELVMLDPAQYNHEGNLRGVQVPYFLGAAFQTSPPTTGNNSKCQGLRGDASVFRAGLLEPPAPPELPPPTPPTCQFSNSTVNQTVNLRPAHHDKVVASTAARSAGTEGEATFNIVGTGCGAGTSFRIYYTYTDSNNTSNTTNTLSLATTNINRGQLGLRLYHDGSQTPLNFGRVPANPTTGGTRISVSSAGTVTVPFTAQYVRAGSAAIQPGPVNAAATITIVNQ